LPRVLDVVLALVLVAVPLWFSESMRTFAAAKLALLQIGIAIAFVLAGFVDAWRVPARVCWVAAGVLGFALAMRPDAEGLAAVAYLATLVGLACLVAWRSTAVDDARLLQVLGIPLGLGLGVSLLQCAGVGVLPATRTSFGDVHGVAVGTIGNPVENTWWLLMAIALVHHCVPRRWLVVAVVAFAVVVAFDRARASAVVGALAIAWMLVPQRRRWLRWATPALVVVAAIAVAAWDGGTALHGRRMLLSIGATMLVDARGWPQGPGAFGRDFEAAQAAHLDDHPDDAPYASILDHAHCDAIELIYELGVPSAVALFGLVVAIARRVRVDPSPRRRSAVLALLVAVGLGVVGHPLFSVATGALVAVAAGLALAPATAAAAPTGSPLPVRLVATAAGAALLVLAQREADAELTMTEALTARVADDDARGLVLAREAVNRFGSADAWFYLGNFEHRAGDCTRALAAWSRSFALRPRAATRRNRERCADTVRSPDERVPDSGNRHRIAIP
jgi:hypothetical protein